MEDDEYLSLALEREEEAPGQPTLSEERLSAGKVVEYVRSAFAQDEFLTREALHEGGWLFYIVVAELAEGGSIGFLKQYNPQRGIRTGRLIAAYQKTLRRFDDPVFNFDLSFDLVVAPDEMAILRVTAFERVFADIEAAAATVPTQVADLNRGLGISIGAPARATLTDACQQRPALARRLRRVAELDHLGDVTGSALGDALEQHGLERDRFGGDDKLVLASSEDVIVLFDMLEQLYYEADFTGEHRRADRYSARG